MADRLPPATPAGPPPAGFPLWGLILLALLFAAGGAIAITTFFGLTTVNAVAGAALGVAFILVMELALRRKG